MLQIDLVHNQIDIDAGVKLACPLKVMLGGEVAIEACFDALMEWRKVPIDVEGKSPFAFTMSLKISRRFF